MYKRASRFSQTLREKGWKRQGVARASQASSGKPKSKIHKVLDAAATARQKSSMAEVTKKAWKLVPKELSTTRRRPE